jgi:formiminotetrahydrofolate cyclodeaminase
MTLVEQSVERFSLLLASDSPVPGGGCGTAVSAALGASFIVMVARITSAKPEFAERRSSLARIADEADGLRRLFLSLVDRDAAAYARFAAAAGKYREPPPSTAGLCHEPRMPDVFTGAGAQSLRPRGECYRGAAFGRRLSLQTALRGCVAPPLEMLETAVSALRLAEELSEAYYPPTASDIGIAALSLETAARGAYLTVHINLKHLKDGVFVREMSEKSRVLIDRAEAAASEIYASVKSRVEN